MTTVPNNVLHYQLNRIGNVVVNMITSSTVYHRIDPRSGQSKDYDIGICCNSVKHTALRSKIKDWWARNPNIV